MTMTAVQKLKREIIIASGDYRGTTDILATAAEITAVWDQVEEDMERNGTTLFDCDTTQELRSGKVNTGITPPSSRHYESRSVGMQCCDGTWIGWTYWYGGGKHGEPASVEWIGHAYDLDCEEKEVTVIQRTFKVKT